MINKPGNRATLQRKFIVEPYGPANTGKTHFCLSLLSSLYNLGYQAEYITPPHVSVVRSLGHQPVYHDLYKAILETKTLSNTRAPLFRRVKAAQKLFAGYHALSASLVSTTNIIILDEGPLQKRRTAAGLLKHPIRSSRLIDKYFCSSTPSVTHLMIQVTNDPFALTCIIGAPDTSQDLAPITSKQPSDAVKEKQNLNDTTSLKNCGSLHLTLNPRVADSLPIFVNYFCDSLMPTSARCQSVANATNSGCYEL